MCADLRWLRLPGIPPFTLLTMRMESFDMVPETMDMSYRMPVLCLGARRISEELLHLS